MQPASISASAVESFGRTTPVNNDDTSQAPRGAGIEEVPANVNLTTYTVESVDRKLTETELREYLIAKHPDEGARGYMRNFLMTVSQRDAEQRELERFSKLPLDQQLEEATATIEQNKFDYTQMALSLSDVIESTNSLVSMFSQDANRKMRLIPEMQPEDMVPLTELTPNEQEKTEKEKKKKRRSSESSGSGLWQALKSKWNSTSDLESKKHDTGRRGSVSHARSGSDDLVRTLGMGDTPVHRRPLKKAPSSLTTSRTSLSSGHSGSQEGLRVKSPLSSPGSETPSNRPSSVVLGRSISIPTEQSDEPGVLEKGQSWSASDLTDSSLFLGMGMGMGKRTRSRDDKLNPLPSIRESFRAEKTGRSRNTSESSQTEPETPANKDFTEL